MLVGDLIYSDSFDVDCRCIIYDCREKESIWCTSEVLYDSEKAIFKPSDWILDLGIKYITVLDNQLIIEAE